MTLLSKCVSSSSRATYQDTTPFSTPFPATPSKCGLFQGLPETLAVTEQQVQQENPDLRAGQDSPARREYQVDQEKEVRRAKKESGDLLGLVNRAQEELQELQALRGRAGVGAKDHQVPQGGKAAWDVLDPLDQEDSLAHQATATLLHVLATMLELKMFTTIIDYEQSTSLCFQCLLQHWTRAELWGICFAPSWLI